MADSNSFCEYQDDLREEMLQINKDLESMLEDVGNISVQMTWMAYDMVVLRTQPELCSSLHRLEEEYQRCKAAVCGKQPEKQDPMLDHLGMAHQEMELCPSASLDHVSPLTT